MRTVIFGLLFCIGIATAATAVAAPYSFKEDLADEISKSDFLLVSQDRKSELLDIVKSDSFTLEQARQIVNEVTGNNLVQQESSQNSTNDKHRITVEGSSRNHQSHYLTIHGEVKGLNSQHAIHNISGYIENRIGPGLANFLSSQKQKVLVLGSDPHFFQEDLRALLPRGQYEVSSIPSIYEKWGLFRYWIQDLNSKKSYFVLLVPSSLQYVRHYATMLNSISQQGRVQAWLNEKSQITLQAKLKLAAQSMLAQFGRVDVLFFGYENNWIQTLNGSNTTWKLLSQNSMKTDYGLSLNLIEIQHIKSGRRLKLASIKPDQTVWGELASFYFQALLYADPKIVLFMGSAGSMKSELKPYQVSIPEKFYLPGGQIKLQNWLLEADVNILKDKSIYQEAHHGMTYSPIQQGKRYVKTLIEAGIHTVDVEQAMVARMVEDYNHRTQKSILFGAVNVITDQPGLVVDSAFRAKHDLDVLDVASKNLAKSKAVEVALQALDSWVDKNRLQPIMCRSLFVSPIALF